MRLVEEIHKKVEKIVKEGDLAIDGTIGNGHDTLLLAKCGARVIGFDIQDLAIQNTRERLREGGYLEEVSLYKRGHEGMFECVPGDWVGKVRVVMFNLGYLPGGDKSVVTRPETTLLALGIAYGLLCVGGYLSIVLYEDHEGGREEVSLVRAWIGSLGGRVEDYLRPGVDRGPEWFMVGK